MCLKPLSLNKSENTSYTTRTNFNKHGGEEKREFSGFQWHEARQCDEREMMEVHTWVVWGPCEWEPLVSCRGDTRPPENTAGTSSWHEMQCSEGEALHRAALSIQNTVINTSTHTCDIIHLWNSLCAWTLTRTLGLAITTGLGTGIHFWNATLFEMQSSMESKNNCTAKNTAQDNLLWCSEHVCKFVYIDWRVFSHFCKLILQQNKQNMI